MINKFRKNKEDNKNTINPVVVEAAGAVAIAGIEIAMALRDKKTRENTKKMLIDVKDQAIKYVENLEIQVNAQGKTNTNKKVVK